MVIGMKKISLILLLTLLLTATGCRPNSNGLSVISYNETHGRYEIKKSAFSGDGKIVFDYFYTPQDNPVDQDIFATDCAKLINSYMKRLENEILISKMGITLYDIGFTYYK